MNKREIPIRKIELSRDAWHVRARILPQDATFTELNWRLTNAAGADSNLGELLLDVDSRGATLLPSGNGEVFIRCATTNGLAHAALYAQISLQLSGFGEAAHDPFSFIPASLFSYSNVELENGIERGVATLRDARSLVCFEGLDFGEEKSDELSIWLFPMTGDPFRFEVWDGKPGEGGEKLSDPLYDKGMIWNQYQEVPVKLSQPLQGRANLCFVFRQKIHIKGFSFHRSGGSYQTINASSCHVLYGDNFLRSGGAVLHILNNTTLGFERMNFADPGTDRVEIVWKSRNSSNPLQLLFNTDRGQARVMLNLNETMEYRKTVFPLGQTVRGRGQVSLVFLPGVSLDLASLRFVTAEDESPYH